MTNELDKLILTGFTKGNNIGYYLNYKDALPDTPGVYIIALHDICSPVFLPIGTGGFFKGKNPNVPIQELRKNWVDDTSILYIGKATSLKKRLLQYFKFGQGANIGHWGGRYIWQLSNANDLIVYWKPTLDKDPEIVETELIQSFKQSHEGMRPFANLTK